MKVKSANQFISCVIFFHTCWEREIVLQIPIYNKYGMDWHVLSHTVHWHMINKSHVQKTPLLINLHIRYKHTQAIKRHLKIPNLLVIRYGLTCGALARDQRSLVFTCVFWIYWAFLDRKLCSYTHQKWDKNIMRKEWKEYLTVERFIRLI